MAHTSMSKHALALLLRPSAPWWFSAPFWCFVFFIGAALLSPVAFPSMKNSSGVHTVRLYRNATGFTQQDETGTAEVWEIGVHCALLRQGSLSTISLLIQRPRCIENEQFPPPEQPQITSIEHEALLQAIKGPSFMSELLLADPSWTEKANALAQAGGGATSRIYAPVMIARAFQGLMIVAMGASLAIGFGRHSQRVFYRAVLRTAKQMHCPNCNYDMQGLETMRCPECGTDFWQTVKSAEKALGKVLGESIM